MEGRTEDYKLVVNLNWTYARATRLSDLGWTRQVELVETFSLKGSKNVWGEGRIFLILQTLMHCGAIHKIKNAFELGDVILGEYYELLETKIINCVLQTFQNLSLKTHIHIKYSTYMLLVYKVVVSNPKA